MKKTRKKKATPTPLLHKCIFRPGPAPGAGVPFGARSVGHYKVPPGWRETRAPRHFVQFFWGISGEGSLEIEGKKCALRPETVAVYFPGMEHRIEACGNKPWEYRWWTIDGPMAAETAAAFGLRPGVYQAGPAPAKLFRQLEKAIRDVSPKGERRAICIAFELMSLALGSEPPHGEPAELAKKALAIFRSRWNDYRLSVKTLSAELGVHRLALTRSFTAAIGMPPKEYLSSLRIQHALTLLKETRLPVAEVAVRCGIKDSNYFSRLISRRFGISPLQFRKL